MKRRLLLAIVAALASAPPGEAQQLNGSMLPTQGAMPLAASTFSGTGATNAPTLAHRATDGGVTFNLKEDFGAACDGSTDDTAAIQAWLAKAAPGVRLVAPGGTCVFSSPLAVGAASHYAIAGAGPQTSIFRYAGAATGATLLTINAPNAAAVHGITLAGFRMQSATPMTDGFAIQINGMFASVLEGVSVDQPAYGDAYDGNFCGGVWFNGAAGVDYRHPNLHSTRACGDGVRVNSNLGATAELRLVGGQIDGFAVGAHEAGGFGGFRCDMTNIAQNGGGVLIDNAVVAAANREFDMGSTCAVDASTAYGVKVNDTLSGGGTIDIAGWVASTKAGHGIEIDAWGNGDVELRGHKIYNNCGSGVYVADASTHVLISSGEYINNNGANLNSACTTWQTANPGHGYGVEAGVSTSKIWNAASIPTQSAGLAASNANAHIQTWSQSSAGVTWLSNPSGAAGLVLSGASGSATGYFALGGTIAWGVGQDASGFEVWDYGNSGLWAIHCASGGSCALGEQASNILTVIGSLAAKSGSTPTASGSCAVNNQLGGQIAGSFKANGACASGTVILTFAATQANGYSCDAHDETTPADAMNQTAHSTTSVTFTGTMAASDTIVWKCVGF